MRSVIFLALVFMFYVQPLLSLRAQEPDETPTESTATPDATQPSDELVIRVWWPDALYALEDRAVSAILEDQIERFNQSNPQYDVDLRLKPHTGQGSSLTTSCRLSAPRRYGSFLTRAALIRVREWGVASG